MGQFLNRLRILKRQFFAGPHLFRHPAESKWFQMKHKNDVRSNAGDQLANVFVEPAPDRRDTDDDGDSNHNAQYGQCGAQLVIADRLRRHAKDFAEFTFAHHKFRLSAGSFYISNRSATIGSSSAALRAG